MTSFKCRKNFETRFSDSLNCPNCGRQLCRFDDIGVKTEDEILADKKYKEWLKKFKPDLDDFTSYIELYPYLGANHKLGKKIIELINKFPTTEIKDSNWYRARKITDGRKFSHSDMNAPDPEKVQIGEGS